MTEKQYSELVNMSVYPWDMERFGGKWSEVERFVSDHGLDGVELLIGYDPVPENVPKHLIKAVHLPCSMGWFRVWQGKMEFPADDSEFQMALHFYGGKNRDELIEKLRSVLKNAALLEPGYAVYHVCYVEPSQVFTRCHGCTDEDVLAATAEMLNKAVSVFPGGEPPVPVYFENLWWPGLKFTDNEATMGFMRSLEFSNWGFVLDSGHLMNATMSCDEEEASIDTVVRLVNGMPDEIRDRIHAMHFHCSLSGSFQKEALKSGLPPGFDELPFEEQFTPVMSVIENLDQHRPFSTGKCREILDAVNPEYLTHEFGSRSAEDLDRKVTTQRRSLYGDEWPI